MNNEIRLPKQKRAIEKKEKIIDAGWNLITKNGYYNTNTAEIAKKAGVSTGIVYQYFNDKHDILIEAINKYGDEIFYPVLKFKEKEFNKSNFSNIISEMIYQYIKEHNISKKAHEEVMAMVHTDEDVAKYYYEREINLTNELYNILIDGGFDKIGLKEKVHIIIGMIDNLCHEIVYHKHDEMDYKLMCRIIIENIEFMIKK